MTNSVSAALFFPSSQFDCQKNPEQKSHWHKGSADKKNTTSMHRRTFIKKTSNSLGAVISVNLTGLSPKSSGAKVKPTGRPIKLLATTDYIDNLFVNLNGSSYEKPVPRSKKFCDQHRYFMTREQLDDLHKALVKLGVTRHQWMFSPMFGSLYENYPHQFDLLAEAADSAHAHGLEFYAIIKPFESGGYGDFYPHTLPFPPKAPAFKDIRGINPFADRFASAHPHLNMKRRPGTSHCHEPVTEIRLIKRDDNPTRIESRHLSLWTSATNNHFTRYTGPLFFREIVEPRYRFPYWKNCRILSLSGLELPQDHKYFLIKCSVADNEGTFGNEMGSILELVGSGGQLLPHTLGTEKTGLEEHHNRLFKNTVHVATNRYLQLPAVKQEINDARKMQEHYQDYYNFGEYVTNKWKTLDQDGYLVTACGKPEYMLGTLHPIYPEVREYWLDLTRFCLERGVDGINYRAGNHTIFPDFYEYGFNEPVLKTANGKTDYPTISKINGTAYTQFLRQAKSLIKSYGKGMTLHLHTHMLVGDERKPKNPLPPNLEWQWQKWIDEIADDFELRGMFSLRPWNQKKVIDIFSDATQKAGKPLYYQSDFHGYIVSFNGSFSSTKHEIEVVKNHPGLDGLVLYETACYTLLNDEHRIELSPNLENVIKKGF
ncbi:hypothetical protein GF406_23080 [candidate division KSB1 bacterium]|nr:hypothetical protein [candidate division KSB1 bacterium]